MIESLNIESKSKQPWFFAGLIFEHFFMELESCYASQKIHHKNRPKENFFNDLICDYREIISLIEESRRFFRDECVFTWECCGYSSHTNINLPWDGGHRWEIKITDKEIAFTKTHNPNGEL
jgi:hypothetical protein